MKQIGAAFLLFSELLCNACLVNGQEKAKAEDRVSDAKATEAKVEPKRNLTPLRLQVVIAEYDGEKKVSSFPYSLLVNAEQPRGSRASLRIGLKVPITSDGKESHYQDLDTNIDAWCGKTDDGRFILHLVVGILSAYKSGSAQKPGEVGGNQVSATMPVIQQFTSDIEMVVRDGQSAQSTVATDPLSGRVTKLEATINALK